MDKNLPVLTQKTQLIHIHWMSRRSVYSVCVQWSLTNERRAVDMAPIRSLEKLSQLHVGPACDQNRASH